MNLSATATLWLYNTVMGRPSRSPFTTAQLDEMARRYQNGESPGDLAASYGIHRNSLFKILRRHGTPLRKESPAPAGLIEDYRAGMPMTSLARQHGVSPNLIKRWLTQEGVEIRGRGETNRRRAEAMTPEERAERSRTTRRLARVARPPELGAS